MKNQSKLLHEFLESFRLTGLTYILVLSVFLSLRNDTIIDDICGKKNEIDEQNQKRGLQWLVVNICFMFELIIVTHYLIVQNILFAMSQSPWKGFIYDA